MRHVRRHLNNLALALALLIMVAGPSYVSAQKGTHTVAGACDIAASEIWLETFTVHAFSTGPCDDHASIALVVRNSMGQDVWSFQSSPPSLFAFDLVTTPDAMREALELWIGQYATTGSTGTLDPWLAGDEGPSGGEFPFLVEEGTTRQTYEAARSTDRPMICYIQGQESARCLHVSEDGTQLETLGVQLFPG